MNKHDIRMLKSHYGVRWTAFKHNRKHLDKILPLEECGIIRNFLPGKVLMLDCLGELYQGLLEVTTEAQPCATVGLINPLMFKYKTPAEIVSLIYNTKCYLTEYGRIIVNINLKFLVYHRLCMSVQTLRENFQHLLLDAGFNVQSILLPINKVKHGYGELLLICDCRD